VIRKGPHISAMTPGLSFWRLQWIGWAAFWLAMTWTRVGRFPLLYMAVSKAVMAIIGLLLTGFVLRPLYRRLVGNDSPLMRTIVVTTVASYIVATAWTATHGLLDLPIERALLNPNIKLTSLWQVFGGALYNTFTLLSWSVLYVGIKHQQAMHAERERALRAEALAQSARLEALRYQLNPHFLFNSLNAVSTLVTERRNEDATTMIARLADLLRATLDRPTGESITLGEELDVVRRYLAIEQIRLGERLRIDFEVDGDALQARVPPLLLQPLVENAVRHAISPRAEGGRLFIRANRRNGRLRMIVEDDGPGMKSGFTPGVGLANTRDRLRLTYGDDHALAIEPASPSGLRVVIDVPYHE
jgi:two-component system LytT family sensor kinase